MREIRMLRSMWRGLETESRSGLHGHERGNPEHGQDHDLRTTAPALDPTKALIWPSCSSVALDRLIGPSTARISLLSLRRVVR